MKRIILIIIAVFLGIATPFLFIFSYAWEDMTGIPAKAFQCASVVTFWAGAMFFSASNPQPDEETSTKQ